MPRGMKRGVNRPGAMGASDRDGRGRAGATTPEQAARLFAMEDELNILSGVMAALSVIGQGRDPVEPRAIAGLARTGDETMERLMAAWHAALAATRNDSAGTFGATAPADGETR